MLLKMVAPHAHLYVHKVASINMYKQQPMLYASSHIPQQIAVCPKACTNLPHQLCSCSLEDRFQCSNGALLRQLELEFGIDLTDFGLEVCLVLRTAGKRSPDFCWRVHAKAALSCGVRLQGSKVCVWACTQLWQRRLRSSRH